VLSSNTVESIIISIKHRGLALNMTRFIYIRPIQLFRYGIFHKLQMQVKLLHIVSVVNYRILLLHFFLDLMTSNGMIILHVYVYVLGMTLNCIHIFIATGSFLY